MFIILAIIILLLLAFILWGIASFSNGGNFGSIINSLFPACSCLVVSQKRPADP